jgi:hypothetical protein
MESDDLVAAARASEVDVAYLTHDGIHDWPYVREDLRAAIDRGLFEPVPESPARWTYRTVAQTGEAWGLRYSFARPPEEVVTFRRDGDRLTGEGGGAVTIGDGACEVTVTPSFEVGLDPLPCTSGQIRLTVSPVRVRAGRATRLRARATTQVAGRTVAVPGARVRVRGRSVLTGAGGQVGVTVAVSRRRTELAVSASKRPLRRAVVTLRVLAPRRR